MDFYNKSWTLKEIAWQFKKDNPDWKWKKCFSEAKKIKNGLDSLNQKEYRDNRKYYKKNCELYDDDYNDDFLI